MNARFVILHHEDMAKAQGDQQPHYSQCKQKLPSETLWRHQSARDNCCWLSCFLPYATFVSLYHCFLSLFPFFFSSLPLFSSNFSNPHLRKSGVSFCFPTLYKSTKPCLLQKTIQYLSNFYEFIFILCLIQCYK